jgi:hypothetical protein
LDDPSDPNFDLMLDNVEPSKEYLDLLIEEKFDDYRSSFNSL